MLSAEENLFFIGKPHEAALYERLKSSFAEIGECDVRVQKTQITFVQHHVFACVSLRWKECIVVTFGLPWRLDSKRIYQAVEAYPQRWTHHIKIKSGAEIDGELIGWLAAAYDYASKKH